MVVECQEFSILPPEEELVDFLYENVLSDGDKTLFTKVLSLFSDESARKYLVRMTKMPAPLSWQKYLLEEFPGQDTETRRRRGM